MKRRAFLSTAVAGAVVHATRAFPSVSPGVPIIDTHIHLFDVNRPQGVPWPPKGSVIYKSALPARYRRLAAPHGIVGAIEIECSSWLEDNQWVLEVAAKDTIIVGTIGDLEPGTPEFARQLERFHKNPLFRGIRYGNIGNRDLYSAIESPKFVSGLKLLAQSGLVLDSANPDPRLMAAIVKVTDRVPELKVIVDHLPELAMPAGAAARQECEANFQRLGQRPQVFGKVSGVVRQTPGNVPLDLAYYRDRLDHIWETFGPDKLMYGSDWPNSDQWAQYPAVFRLADEFISAKDHPTIEKFFWKNSVRIYGWIKRDPSQPVIT